MWMNVWMETSTHVSPFISGMVSDVMLWSATGGLVKLPFGFPYMDYGNDGLVKVTIRHLTVWSGGSVTDTAMSLASW